MIAAVASIHGFVVATGDDAPFKAMGPKVSTRGLPENPSATASARLKPQFWSHFSDLTETMQEGRGQTKSFDFIRRSDASQVNWQ